MRDDALIDERHLLTHPFYTRWVVDDLPMEGIRDYGPRYYAFEWIMPVAYHPAPTRTAASLARHL